MMQQHLQQKGKGLYALRDFQQGEYIGRYSGRLVAHEQDAASLSNSSDKLLTMLGVVMDGAQPLQSPAEQLADFGVVLLDPKDWPYPGMYHFVANDAKNTPMKNNSLVDLEGFIVMTEHVKADAPPYKNAESKLFWSYGDAYWNVHAAQPRTTMLPPHWHDLLAKTNIFSTLFVPPAHCQPVTL